MQEILPLVFSQTVSDCRESLSCRISFISYWCYFVPSGLLSACNGNLGALSRGQVFVQCVCVREREKVCVPVVCLYVRSSCFRQYLRNRPPLHPLPHSLSASATVQSARDLEANLLKVCFPVVFRSVGGISLYFSIRFLLQPLLKCPEYRGLYSNLLNHLLIVDERLLLWVLS